LSSAWARGKGRSSHQHRTNSLQLDALDTSLQLQLSAKRGNCLPSHTAHLLDSKEPPILQQDILNQRHPSQTNQVIPLYTLLLIKSRCRPDAWLSTRMAFLWAFPNSLGEHWTVFGSPCFNLDVAYSSESLSTHFWFSVPSQGRHQCWYSLLEATLLGLWVVG
jgi:hypothetical protein